MAGSWSWPKHWPTPLSAVLGRPLSNPLVRMPGTVFEGLRFRHPLYARDSMGVLAAYVTLDTGTGVVHTAPGHGSDDFHTGVKYGLEIYAPVGGDGRFMDEVERFAGLTVFEANPIVERALSDAAVGGRCAGGAPRRTASTPRPDPGSRSLFPPACPFLLAPRPAPRWWAPGVQTEKRISPG